MGCPQISMHYTWMIQRSPWIIHGKSMDDRERKREWEWAGVSIAYVFRLVLHVLVIGGRFWSNLVELWRQSKANLNKIAHVWSIQDRSRIDSGVTWAHVFFELSGTQTMCSGGEWDTAACRMACASPLKGCFFASQAIVVLEDVLLLQFPNQKNLLWITPDQNILWS